MRSGIAADASRLAGVERRLIGAANEIAAAQMRRFEALRAEGSPELLSDASGFTLQGELAPDGGPHPSSRMKYVLSPLPHIARSKRYLEHLKPIAGCRAFEIGVGVGFLFTLLMETLSVDMTGVDVPDAPVFSDMQRRLGIDDRIAAGRVRAYDDLPVPGGAEAVIATWINFDAGWDLAAHRWFVEECRRKLRGAKLLLIETFTSSPGVAEFYADIGRFPDPAVPRLCLARL